MQSGVLERIRQLQADVELHRREIVKQLLVPAKNYRHSLLVDHFILHKTRQIATKSAELLTLYDDDDYRHAASVNLAPQDALREFDAQIARLREYHRSHPQPPVRQALDEPSFTDGYVVFDAAERHGRCLALQPHYSRYITFINDSGARTAAADSSGGGASGVRVARVDVLLDYEDFVVKIVDVMQSTPCARKIAALRTWADFVLSLLKYLEEFFNKVRPLQKARVALMIKETAADFTAAWDAGVVAGWDAAIAKSVPEAKRVALAEQFVERYITLLPDVLQKTREFTLRQRTKTVEEIEMELEEEEEQLHREYAAALSEYNRAAGIVDESVNATAAAGGGEDGEADGEDETHFNKKNFPLDAEGKPIPVWLYHLHGLHLKKTCEICMHTYYGEVAFVNHFRELRHTKGLQRLGIPENTDDFTLLSTREAALQKFAQIRDRAAGSKYVSRPDEEQNQDAVGNVYTRRR